jgi:hypothetical protein
MRFFSRAQDAKEAIKATTPARLVSVFAGGTLGQRSVLLLGLGAVAFAVFKSLIWVALAVGGWVLCFFAVRDYERTEQS